MPQVESECESTSSYPATQTETRNKDDEEPPSRCLQSSGRAVLSRPAPNVLPVLQRPPDFDSKIESDTVRRIDSPSNQARVTRSVGEQTAAFRREFYSDTSDAQWDDWRWQSRQRIKTLAQMESMLRLSEAERGAMQAGGTMLPIGVTPYYMSLMHPADPSDPIRKTVVPTESEFLRSAGEADDPLGEDSHSPVPGLVHRYPDRVLLLAIDFCSTYCRYCTRSRVVGHGEIAPTESRLEKIFSYLEDATEVRDVLISGGDPLALSDEKLDYILGRLARSSTLSSCGWVPRCPQSCRSESRLSYATYCGSTIRFG